MRNEDENGSVSSTSSAERSAAGFEKRFEDLCDIVQVPVLKTSIASLSRNAEGMMKQGASDGHKKTVGLCIDAGS